MGSALEHYPPVKKGETEAETSKRANSYRPATTAALRRCRQQGPEFKVILGLGLLSSRLTGLTRAPIPGVWVPENLEEPKESKILRGYPFPGTPHSESHAVPQFHQLAMGCAYSHQGTAGG